MHGVGYGEYPYFCFVLLLFSRACFLEDKEPDEVDLDKFGSEPVYMWPLSIMAKNKILMMLGRRRAAEGSAIVAPHWPSYQHFDLRQVGMTSSDVQRAIDSPGTSYHAEDLSTGSGTRWRQRPSLVSPLEDPRFKRAVAQLTHKPFPHDETLLLPSILDQRVTLTGTAVVFGEKIPANY